MLAKIYVQLKNYAAAAPVVDEHLTASPDDPKLRKWKALCDGQTSTESRLANWLQEGQALFSSGRLEEAEQVYLRVLTECPEAGRAHFRLGQIYTRQRRWEDAIPPLRAAIAIDPHDIKISKTLAQALMKAGEPAEALALLDTLDEREKTAGVLFLAQRCHRKLHDWTQVDRVGAGLLSILPDDDPRRKLVSNMRQDALLEIELAGIDAIANGGDLGRAVASYRQLTSQYPEAPLAWLKLGKSLLQIGQGDDATAALRTAFNLCPADIKYREALTRAMIESKEEQEVLRYVQDAIADGTADFECHRWLAQYFIRQQDWQSALENALNALAIDPNHKSARLVLARALMRLSRLAEALDELDVLLSRESGLVEALQLKADIFVRLARLGDAIELYKKALKYAPDHPLLNHRLSYAYLLKGDIAGFHRLHERRRNGRTFMESNKEYPFLDWNGELPIEGKLLVWSEFGLGVGQNILHMTFLKPLVELGLDVVFEVEPRLVELCRRSFPDITVVTNDTELPTGISHHTPIGSLSRWFKPDLESFETLRPYFLPDPQAVAAHRERLQSAAGEGQILVGISWTSNNPYVGDVKSVQLDRLLDAIAIPGVTLVNLQYGDHSQSISEAEARTGKQLMDSGVDNSNDLDGLASVVAALDLVVCIGHTTAHMAGAIGTPNFVLLPTGPFAHWLAEGEQCIWYPATKLFRQAAIDADWGPVLNQVGSAVRDFVDRYDGASWLTGTSNSDLRLSAGRAGALSPRETSDAVRSFAAQRAYRSALKLLDWLPAEHLTRELEMQRGNMLAQIGRWQEARAIYVGLRPADEVDPEIERQILSACLTMHDLDTALPIARFLAEDDPAQRMIVATIFYRLRRHQEALEELRTVSLQAPQIEGLSTLLGTILLEMREFKRAQTYLTVQAAVNRRPDDYTLLGRSLSAQGQREEALSVYDTGVALSRNQADPAAHFWRTQDRIELGLVQLVPLPPLMGDIPIAAPDDTVIYFAGDSAYFWEHGLVLLGSIGRQSPDSKCHVHVINPDPGVAQAIDLIRRFLPRVELSYSYEHVDFERCSEAHIRTYYASVRFVRLAEVFARSRAVYLCLDIDGIVRKAIETQSSALEDADLAIRMRFDERPQMGIVASASMLRPTAGAAKFINRVSALIKSTLEAREAVWFLDQVVLNHVTRELGGGEVSISQLDMTYLDWFFQDESLIWTGKGRRKSDDNRYKAEVSKYRYLQENEEIACLMPVREPDEEID